jgi:glutathione synthase/RimK-type ligase-like ATP-grasp enzyme
MGLQVFPDTDTCWHFDDKIAQKYLLEAIGAPLVPTYVFYEEDEALAWLRGATYPLVRKLRAGPGSRNGRLIRDYAEAKRFCATAFGKGIAPVPGYLADAATKIRTTRGMRAFWDKLRRLPYGVSRQRSARRQSERERGL